MKYRPEIDGLRAIAVLSVLVYHAKFTLSSGVLISGGFLGVDIFFVISGYLITKIIVEQIRGDRFSYLDFYNRRARRILPALFIVVFASTPFAWHTMLPDQLVEYSQSVIGSLFFSSNFVFLTQDSYTAEPSALKPFLHTWSLGIEEQFYIILPIILLTIVPKNSAKQTLTWVLSGLVLSVLFAQGIARHFPDANFFLLTSRAWELLVGSAIALVDLDHKRIRLHRFAGPISALSLITLVGSLFAFDESTLHPSLLTMIPVLACASLITFANAPHTVNRLLGQPVLVKIGLISYSLYLWHFPLFAFYRLQYGEPSLVAKLALCGVSLVLAELSYRWVEKPFRNNSRISNTVFITLIITGFLAIVAFQTNVIFNQGHPSRLGHVETFITEAQAIRLQNGAAPDTPLNPFVALGDSHAGIFSHSLKKIADTLDRPFVQIVQDGCPLVNSVSLYTSGKRVPRCEDIYEPRVEAIKHFNQGIFFYSGRFALYQDGSRFAEEPGYPTLLTNRADGQPAPKALLIETVNTLKELTEGGSKVVLVYPIPEMGFDVPKKFQSTFQGTEALRLKTTLATRPLSITKEAYLTRAGAIIDAFDSIADHPNLIRLKPANLLCDDQRCYAHNDEILYYYDDNHLSPAAVDMIIDSVLPTLQQRGWIE